MLPNLNVRLQLFLFIFVACAVVNYNGVEALGKALEVVYAINAGGDRFEDSNGIVYDKDPSNEGISSDFGRRLTIDRVSLEDEPLYQTERYSENNFGYEIPIKVDGNYIIVLKFSEVYFREPGRKIFNIVLNKAHLVIKDLDIYANVGHAAAHDEVVQFQVSGKTLTVGSFSSDIVGGKVRLDLVKGKADNPKINAFYVVKGDIEDIVNAFGPSQPYGKEKEEWGEEMEEDDDEMMYSDEDSIQFSRSDLGRDNENLHLPKYGAKGKVGRPDIRSGEPADDPWDYEPPYVVYLPLVGSLAASVLAFFIVKLVNNKF